MYANAVQIAQVPVLSSQGCLWIRGTRTSSLALRSILSMGWLTICDVYEHALDMTDLSQIFGQGGGDFNQLELMGAGTTKIVASKVGAILMPKPFP